MVKTTDRGSVIEHALGSLGLFLLGLTGWAAERQGGPPIAAVVAWLVLRCVAAAGWVIDRLPLSDACRQDRDEVVSGLSRVIGRDDRAVSDRILVNSAILLAVFFTSIAPSTPALARQAARYTVPRTENGHPDLQGVWATEFLTTLERPAGVEHLVVSPEQAQALVATLRALRPSVIDPDVQIHDIKQLARVKGEYRTSIIVEPKDGRMPFTQAGLDLAAATSLRNAQKFDHPEQRPLAERCLESLGYAPIRALRVFLPRQIVQTRDHLVMLSEDPVGRRTIHLRGEPPPDVIRSIEGYSVGHWERETLVVRTTHLRADDPARNVIGRPLLLSRKSMITERFTRVSDGELFYQFTVEDDQLYSQPWSGEFSMTKQDGPIYEYACHEGNYSLANSLRGGQAEASGRAETLRRVAPAVEGARRPW